MTTTSPNHVQRSNSYCRGKPSHVLLSIEEYRRLTGGVTSLADALVLVQDEQWDLQKSSFRSVRVGAGRTLDKHDARALPHAVENDSAAVGRHIEITNDKVCRQFSELTLDAGLRIQLPEILAVDV